MRTTRRGRLAVAASLVVTLLMGLVGPMGSMVGVAEAGGRNVTPILGESLLTPAQMASYYRSRGKTAQLTGGDTIDTLTQYYVEEGAKLGVRGDIVFAQSILETGWFEVWGSYVTPQNNNFGGIGAFSGSTADSFPDARTGVRAQMQHIWRYANPNASFATLPTSSPKADTRMEFVKPAGKAPNWDDLGGGNYAADCAYAAKVLGIYELMVDATPGKSYNSTADTSGCGISPTPNGGLFGGSGGLFGGGGPFSGGGLFGGGLFGGGASDNGGFSSLLNWVQNRPALPEGGFTPGLLVAWRDWWQNRPTGGLLQQFGTGIPG